MIRVLIADDQSIVRDGIKLVIEKDENIKTIATATNGNEAVELCEEYLPDVVLIDLGMPVCDGADCTKLIKDKHDKIKVIVLVDSDNRDTSLLSAMINGADGFACKNMSSDELILTINSIVKGLKVFHENIFEFFVNLAKGAKEASLDSDLKEKFSLAEREIQIIKLICLGKSYKEISSILFLSEGSLRNSISKILKKLKLNDRLQLVSFALKSNII